MRPVTRLLRVFAGRPLDADEQARVREYASIARDTTWRFEGADDAAAALGAQAA